MNTNNLAWNCPICGNSFHRPYQWHDCSKKRLERHFLYPEPKLKIIFGTLAAEINSFGEMQIIPVRSGIFFHSHYNFLVVYVKRHYLQIEFVLNRKAESHQVRVIKKQVKNRYTHFVNLKSVSDVTPDLMELITESFALRDIPTETAV